MPGPRTALRLDRREHDHQHRERRAHDRVLNSAYELFSHRSVRDVGVDEIIEHANVAKATLYKHFHSKDELVLAFLSCHEQRWTWDWLAAELPQRGRTPEDRLVAIFDLFDEWFKSRNFAGCPFIKTLLEFGADHPVGRASIHHLDNIRGIVRELAAQARLAEPGSFAHSWHMLMTGSVIAAAQGDLDAAQRAKATAEALLAQYPRAGAA